MAFDDPITTRVVAFLSEIDIRVTSATVEHDSFLPAIAIRDGTLLIDPARLQWPGDLLHEAGHIAVTDPADRPTLHQISADGGEEMAAIAWSYAAALAIGIDPAVVFHAHGYRGGGAALLENFAVGRYIGVPLLTWFGMTDDTYPRMLRWLR